jgi:predicted dehydrogenase
MLRITALVDPAAERAQALRRFFTGAKIYANLNDALTSSPSHLTLILSPAHVHCDQTIEALSHGNHVFCEKPMARTEDECIRMIRAAVKSDRVLAVGMIRRYFPAYAQLRRIVLEGDLGKLSAFEFREGHKFEWEVTTAAAFRPRGEGGTGVLFDIGTHILDYCLWTFGDMEVLAYSDDALAGIESDVCMQVDVPACGGSIHISWDAPQANEFRVVGELGEAVLRVDRFDQLAIKTTSTYEPRCATVSFPLDVHRTARKRLTPTTFQQAILCEIIQMIRAIELLEPPAVDGEAGRRCVALMQSALSKAGPLDTPWLDSVQQAAARRLHWNRPKSVESR